jgi:rhodanese-related sulfurtransferase
MKHRLYIIIPTVLFALILSAGCGNQNQAEKAEIIDSIPEKVNESKILRQFFDKTGHIINQKNIPAMVSADDVFTNKHNYHLIDIRTHSAYVKGHIDGAVNVKKEDLFDYMKFRISASNFDKIVFICYTNQSASYVAMMFRLLGYGNVYSMKYGMSACDRATAETKWWKNVSNKYASALETESNPKNKKSKYPKIMTGKKNAYEILEARVKLLLKKSKFTVKADDVFANPEKYYIVNYWPEEYYLKGHIPGAVQYTPKKSLIPQTKLSTLPINKPIALYCYTGQHAAFVVAYLQVLGYEAYSVSYAANGFMHNKLISSGIGHAYDRNKHFKSYPLVEGELPSLKVNDPTMQTETLNEPEILKPVIKKKQTEDEEGGC